MPEIRKEYVSQLTQRTEERLRSLHERLGVVLKGQNAPELPQINLGCEKRIETAVLFLKFCNYAVLRSDSYPEQMNVLAYLDLFMAEMANIVRDHNGRIERNTGDGLMAYFGVEEGDPALRVSAALDAALTMFYYNDNVLGPFLDQQNCDRVQFGVGLDYGKVTITKIGIMNVNSYFAVGTTVNIAAKLAEISEPDSLYLGDSVRSLLPPARQSACEPAGKTTGYLASASGRPYPVFLYADRWPTPRD